jgi:hypothetical protein
MCIENRMTKALKNSFLFLMLTVVFASCSKDPEMCGMDESTPAREERMQPMDGTLPSGDGATDGSQITDDDDDDDESESSKKAKGNN